MATAKIAAQLKEAGIARKTPGEAAGLLSERWFKAAEEPTGEDETQEPGDGEEEEASETSEEEPETDAEVEDEEGEEEEPGELKTEPGDDTGADGETELETAGDDEDRFTSLSELMDAGEAKAEDLRVTVRSNGKDLTVNLKEALAGYQRQTDYTRRRSELDDAESSFATAKAAQIERLNTAVQNINSTQGILDEIFEADENAIHKHYESVNWAQLRTSDKAEYSAAKQDYDAALERNEKRKGVIQKRVSDALDKHSTTMEEQRAEFSTKQHELLLERVPAWRDDEVLEREGAEVAKYLVNVYGASAADMKSIQDHRMLDMARKAMLFDRLQKKAAKVVKKTKGKKKLRSSATAAPGRSGTEAGRNLRLGHRSQKSKDASAKLSKSHRQSDAVNVLSARWDKK